VVALLVGLIIANFFPRLAEWLKESGPSRALHQDRDRDPGRVSWRVTAAGKLTLATSILFARRGRQSSRPI